MMLKLIVVASCKRELVVTRLLDLVRELPLAVVGRVFELTLGGLDPVLDQLMSQELSLALSVRMARLLLRCLYLGRRAAELVLRKNLIDTQLGQLLG